MLKPRMRLEKIGQEAIRLAAAAMTMLTLVSSSTLSQEIGDPLKGRLVAESRCAECHAFRARRGAPTFSAIAHMPSTTALALTVFLQSSHFNMPNLVLSRVERDNLVAYILSLRR